MGDHGPKTNRQRLGPERGTDAHLETLGGEEAGHPGDVDEDVLVTLVVPTPGSVVVFREDRHLANESIGARHRELGHERPVVADPAAGPRLTSRLAPGEVAQVEGEDASWAKGSRGAEERCSTAAPSVR